MQLLSAPRPLGSPEEHLHLYYFFMIFRCYFDTIHCMTFDAPKKSCVKYK